MPRLLVIDDEPIYHKMIANALADGNYQIDSASNGTQGIEMAHSLSPDIIITDVVMPNITGYEITRRLRREPQFAQTPILILTSQTDLQDKLKSFEAGADDHLTKPFEPAELAARVASLLRRAESARTSNLAPANENAHMIAVHSLRGGVGCSSLAVNLGVGLVGLWKRPAALLDLTMTAGQVALMLNMTLRRTWADIARFNAADLDFGILSSILCSHESRLAFVAAPTFPSQAEPLPPELLAAAFRLFKSQFDYIVADLPHDFSDPALQALDAADVILVVATPDMASVRAMTAAFDTYEKLGYPREKIRLLLNSVFPRAGLPRDKIEAALGITALTVMPYTPDVFVEAINRGQPVLFEKPHEPVSAFLEDLAFSLSKPAHKKSAPQEPSEMWKRVYKRYQERRKYGSDSTQGGTNGF